MIVVDETRKLFHLKTRHTSYVMDIVDGGWLRHLYWGATLEDWHGAACMPMMDRSFAANPVGTPQESQVVSTLMCKLL